MPKQILRILKGQTLVELENIPPDRTLLELIREDLQLKGTKEGCAEGDCGACTVVVGRIENETIDFQAINSCIRLAHSIQNQVLLTVEDLKQPDGQLHPCQQAMVDQHGSQCGFCTPGFVMSLFAMYERYVPKGIPIRRKQAEIDLAGNLCRCTGYRPIFDAASRMVDYPKILMDREGLKSRLLQLQKINPCGLPIPETEHFYFQPDRLDVALAARSAHPDALVVAGSTDAGLWITKRQTQYPKILDLSQTKELLEIQQQPDLISLGAAVPLSRAFAVLKQTFPNARAYLDRYAGLPIRESATLGGNIATGSPIGDSMPFLIALGATLTLRSAVSSRQCTVEDFYTGYRKNLLAKDELITDITIPKNKSSRVVAYKLSKRRDDDISIVALAASITVTDGLVTSARIGVGGMAERPMRAARTEQSLMGERFSSKVIESAAACIQKEFDPISDMRASAAYRTQAIGQLVRRIWIEWNAQ